MWVQSLGWEDALAEGMATCSSILHTINKGANFKNKRFFQQLARMFKNLSPAIAWKIIHWCFLFCVGFLSKSCFLLLSQNYFESVIENILVTQKG